MLVDQPKAVRVTEAEHQRTLVLELFVAPDDLGRIIGRQGRTAAALRTLASAAGDPRGSEVTLEFREAPPPAGHRGE